MRNFKKNLVQFFLLGFLAIFISGCSLPWQEAVIDETSSSQIEKDRVTMVITTKEGKSYDYPINYQSDLSTLDLFQFAGVVIETEDYDFGSFVKSISGMSQGDGYFWIYYVNGTPGNVAADQYIVQKGDQIEWKLEEEKEGL